MRTLFYLQILILLIITMYVFILRYELLIAILGLVIIQFLLLARFNVILPLIYLIINFAWIGLINLPIVGFIFAILYLLFSLLVFSFLKKTTFLFSSKYEFSVFTTKNLHNESINKSKNRSNNGINKKRYSFSSILNDLKRPYYFTKNKMKKNKKHSSQSSIKDAEFYEK